MKKESEELFILVVYYNGLNPELISKKKASDVLQYASNLKEAVTINRIFSVNEEMKTREYQIIFDGQLKLV